MLYIGALRYRIKTAKYGVSCQVLKKKKIYGASVLEITLAALLLVIGIGRGKLFYCSRVLFILCSCLFVIVLFQVSCSDDNCLLA